MRVILKPAIRPLSALLALVATLLFAGCEEAQHAQQVIHQDHVPRIQAIVREDIARTEAGTRIAAQTISRGFVVEDPEQRAHQMRIALLQLTRLPRGIPELTISPIAFVAVVGMDGVVICRDSVVPPNDPRTPNQADPMRGQNVGELFPHVQRALREGVETRAVVEWPGLNEGDPSVTIDVQATPIRRDGTQLGVIIAGTPLWRTAQRITRQLQTEVASEGGSIVWVYLYRGDAYFSRATPENLDAANPDAEARAAGFATSPGGFTGQMLQHGRWFAYGVVPLPSLAEDIGFVIWRSDPV